MIFHEIKSDNPVEVFLNLEELLCLKTITNQPCSVKTPDKYLGVFDFRDFILVNEVPDFIECDISDYVCMYQHDFNDVIGSEFISYRKNQKGKIFRLDKFSEQDFNIVFSNPNYYESKYWSGEKYYKEAIGKSFEYTLSDLFLDQYKVVQKIFKRLPLLVLSDEIIGDRYNFDFKECYFINPPGNFLYNNNLKGHDIKDILYNYNVSLQNINLDLILMTLNCFTDIYGTLNDNLFGIVSKKNPSKILGRYSFGSIDNFNFKIVQPNAIFPFSRISLNIDRSELLSLMRFREINDFV